MNDNETLLGAIARSEPEFVDHVVSRREVMARGGRTGAGVAAALALGSIPVALAALAREAYGQSTGGTVQDVLNFALMLEIFENEFYKAVLGTSASAAQNNAFSTVRAQASAAVPALQQIQKHEQAHVATLQGAGAANVLNLTADSFDFTGARGAGNGPFALATSNVGYLLAVAQGAEDTGVRAYKGQAGNLMSNTAALETALRIHSVEARHASKIRRLRRASGAATVKYSGTITGGGAAAAGGDNLSPAPTSAVVAAFALIYAGEDNVSQAGVDVTTLSFSGIPGFPAGNDLTTAATEAFDEPLTKDQVRTIVQPFFIPTIPA